MTKISKELVGATAVPMILSILEQGESYGYQIIQKVKKLSNNQIVWKEGSLYPVLHKMENAKLIKSEWQIAENGRPRKYYVILDGGKEMLLQEKENWKMVNDIFAHFWG
ncbi:PadR family transcriptional regulator [Prolixibacteraceae bacterium JC049]|nr:PadR family transcriptional regulator [Prolixibacteraceae bacterium JC049]